MSGAFFANSAIRCCLVETVDDFDISLAFPFNSSLFRHPSISGVFPSLHGIPWVGSPASAVQWGCSDSPAPVSHHLVVLRLHDTDPARHDSLPRWLCAAPGQGTLVTWGPDSPLSFGGSETPASPRFPGCPSTLALLSDPGRTSAPSPFAGAAVLPAGRSKPSAPTSSNHGAQSHSSCFRCLRFAVGVAPRPRKTC